MKEAAESNREISLGNSIRQAPLAAAETALGMTHARDDANRAVGCNSIGQANREDARALAAGATQRATAATAAGAAGSTPTPQQNPVAAGRYDWNWRERAREKERTTQAELNAGRGPSDDPNRGPIHVKPEALARIRAREEARAKAASHEANAGYKP